MNKIKLLIITLAVFSSFLIANDKTFAEVKIGLVDMTEIVKNYNKAKEAQAALQANQEELKKMILKAREDVKKVDEKEREDLEKKLADEIMKKNNKFKEDFSKKWKKVQNNILTTIKKVSDQEKLDMVIDKQTVIAGGEDITKQVLKELK